MKKKIVFITIVFILILTGNIYIMNKRSEKAVLETVAKPAKYEILVDVEESKLYVFEDKKVIKTYSCSGGKWSTPSPIGTWTIITKQLWGEGFGGRWMRIKCTMGRIWNTWNSRYEFCGMGKFTWLY